MRRGKYMAKRRMVSQSIWTNRRFLRLNNQEKLLYIGLVTISDDEGRLWNDGLSIRSKIFPADSIELKEITENLEKIGKKGLIELSDESIQLVGWNEHQNIRKDRLISSVIPIVTTKRQPDDNQMSTKRQPSDNQVTQNLKPRDTEPQTNCQSNIIEYNITKHKSKTSDADASLLSVFGEFYEKSFEVEYHASFGKDNKLLKDLEIHYGREKVLAGIEYFFNNFIKFEKFAEKNPTVGMMSSMWNAMVSVAQKDKRKSDEIMEWANG